MTHQTFQVKPVKRYQGARYPSFAPAPPEEEKPGPLMILLSLVLVLGLAFGMVSCFANYKKVCDDGLPPDPNGDCPGDGPDCLPGLVVCRGDTIAATCNQDGHSWTNQDCVEQCGPEATQVWCDAQAAQPCQCKYDIVDGGIPECTQGDVICQDENTVAFCTEDQGWESFDCGQYCQDTYGLDYWSAGCDAGAEEPCQCQYDIVEGLIAECTPGEFACYDEQTAMVCFDSYDYRTLDCERYCQETFGEQVATSGCDPQAETPCTCYDIVDGDPAECTPGEFLDCRDENTARVCGSDGYTWTYQDCSLRCLIFTGFQSTTAACNQDDPEDFCSCSD